MSAGSVTSFPGFVIPNSGSGHYPWTSYASAKLDDGQYASAVFDADRDADELLFSAFDFSQIPATATIKGIQVTIEAHASIAGRIVANRFRLSRPATITLSLGSTTPPSTWPATDASFSVGGATELWGATTPWDPTNDLGNSFLVGLFCDNTVKKKTTGYLDYLKVTVYYET